MLVTIDPSDAKLALAEKEADYGRAIRRVKQYFATNETAAADISARDADIARAQSQVVSAQAELDKARVDLQRREALSASGAVSGRWSGHPDHLPDR